MTGWRTVHSAPEGVLVLTMSAGGVTQKLLKRGRLWFVSDAADARHVLYTPEYWRPIVAQVKP